MASSSTLHGLFGALPQFGDCPAVVALQKDGKDTWSYRMLSDYVARVSLGLASAGLRRGDRVALFARNRPEWIVACLAANPGGRRSLSRAIQPPHV